MLARRRSLALASAGLLLAACTAERIPASPSHQQRIPVTVYFHNKIHGEFGYLVVHAYRGARLRFAELDRDPTFPAEIRFDREPISESYGLGSDPLQKAVNDSEAIAGIPIFSGTAESIAKAYDEAGIPLISPSVSDQEPREKERGDWYGMAAPYEDEASALAEWIVHDFDRIYIIHNEGRYAKGLAEAVIQLARQEGDRVVAAHLVDYWEEEYSPLIREIRRSEPDVVLYAGFDGATGLFTRQARDAGLNLPIWSGEGSVSDGFLRAARESATNVVLSCGCNLEGRRDFRERYEARYGETEVPLRAAEGYDVASLIGEGIRSAVREGAADPTAIREGIKHFLDGLTVEESFEGVAKDIAFVPETHELAAEHRREVIFFYRVEDGEVIQEGSAAEVLGPTR